VIRGLTLHKINSHGQDHHGGSDQDKNSWLFDPQTSAAGPRMPQTSDHEISRAKQTPPRCRSRSPIGTSGGRYKHDDEPDPQDTGVGRSGPRVLRRPAAEVWP